MGRSGRESSGIVRGLQAWGRDIPSALAISLGGLVATTLTLPACVGDAAPLDVVEYEEQGVVYVEHPGIHLADTASLRFGADEVFRVGEPDGPREYVFGRVAGVLLRSDGTVLVADGITSELRRFDLGEGTLVGLTGGMGEGPGEFMGIVDLMKYSSDSVLVVDRRGISVLDPDLEFVRRASPWLEATRGTELSPSHSVESTFDDGDLLMSDFLNVCGAARLDGFCEDSVAFFRTDLEGNVKARYGSFVYAREENRRAGGNRFVGWSEPHPQPMWTTHGSRFYYADARRFEVQVFSPEGNLERVIRVGGDAPRYDKETAMPPPWDGADEEERRVHREAQEAAVLPDDFPWFSDLRVATDGHVWLREYVPPGLLDERPPRWFVFDPEGRLRHLVRSPPGLVHSFRPFGYYLRAQFGPELAVGVLEDALGVESVVAYRLVKP